MRVDSRAELGDGRVREDTRYYLSRLPPEAARHLELTRAHWSIENSCHWVLDVVFGEGQAPDAIDGQRLTSEHNPRLRLARKMGRTL